MDDGLIEIDWYPYEDGATVGKTGTGGGVVRRDEELGATDDPEYADARLTLEQESQTAYTLTAVLYGGWMLHTLRFATEAEANAAFDALKDEVEELADRIPDESDRDIAGGVRALNEAIAAFQSRHPS